MPMCPPLGVRMACARRAHHYVVAAGLLLFPVLGFWGATEEASSEIQVRCHDDNGKLHAVFQKRPIMWRGQIHMH